MAEKFDIRMADMTSKRRPENIAFPRQIAMYLSHVGLGLSLARIATALGRDRSTVAYGCHRIEDFRDDPDIDDWLDDLELRLRSAASVNEGARPPIRPPMAQLQLT